VEREWKSAKGKSSVLTMSRQRRERGERGESSRGRGKTFGEKIEHIATKKTVKDEIVHSMVLHGRKEESERKVTVREGD